MKPFNHTHTITSVSALSLFGADRNPVIRAYVTTSSGHTGVAESSLGNVDVGVQEACVNYVTTITRKALVGQDVLDQERLDASLIVLDAEIRQEFGPEPLKHALRAVSIAALRAGASATNVSLVERIRSLASTTVRAPSQSDGWFPLPIVSVLFGRAFGDTGLDFYEYHIGPVRSGGLFRRRHKRITDELTMLNRVVMMLGRMFERQGMKSHLGIGGGYAVPLDSTMQAFDDLLAAIRESGFVPGVDVDLGINLGSSVLFDHRIGEYVVQSGQQFLNRTQLIELLLTWLETYPISYVQDPFDRDDWDATVELRSTLNQRKNSVQSDSVIIALESAVDGGVGSIRHAARIGANETIIVSVSSVHTVSEIIHRVRESKHNGMEVIVSCVDQRVSDSFAVDLAAGIRADGLKAGSFISGDSVQRWNRLVEIGQQELGIRN